MRKTGIRTVTTLASLAVGAFMLVTSTSALAADSFFVGPRALGMAGANIASVDNNSAYYYNPAAYGFFSKCGENGDRLECDNNNLGRKDWGMDVGVGVGVRLFNGFGDYVQTLADIDYEGLGDFGIQDQSDLEDLINVVGSLSGLDEPGNAISVDLNAGLGMRYKHLGLNAHAYTQATARVLDIDDQNLGLSLNSADLDSEINNTPVDGFDAASYTPTMLTGDLYTSLSNAGLSDAAIAKLDFVAVQEEIDPALLADATDLLVTITNDSAPVSGGGATSDLGDNQTTVLLEGFGYVEVPLSYGYALNDNWSVGGNLKLMQGRVYGNQIVVFDDDSDEVLERSDEFYQETSTFGVDLGVMGRYKRFNFGLVGRNLNGPEFDGFSKDVLLSTGNTVNVTVDKVKLDPQVAAGAAFIPFETLTLEMDYDITENDTTLPGYKTQNLGFGLEWDAFRTLALRAGTYKNLSEDDMGWVYTAGVGLNLWAARLDIAGAFATESAEFDGDELPKETRVAAQLSVDF